MNDWITAFKNAAKERRYLLVGLVTLAISLTDKAHNFFGSLGITEWIGVPSWVVGTWVGIGFIFYWTLNRVVELERRIRGARASLAKLRSRGVELRNEAQDGFSDDDEWRKWWQRATEWNNEVIAELKKFSEGDAEWFSVLDVVPPPRIGRPDGTPDQKKRYRIHDFRLKRLGDMIYELWREQ